MGVAVNCVSGSSLDVTCATGSSNLTEDCRWRTGRPRPSLHRFSAEMVGYMLVEELAGIELGLELGDSKSLRHDFDHAEGVSQGRFAQGETGVRVGVDDHHFGAFVCQYGSQHA